MVAYTGRPFYLHREMSMAGARYAAASLGLALSKDDGLELFRFRLEPLAADIEPRPGMSETLAGLRARGLHAGGASNSDIDELEVMVESLGVKDAFDSLMCSEHA